VRSRHRRRDPPWRLSRQDEYGGRPHACLRPCPASMPQAARRSTAVACGSSGPGPGPAAPARVGMAAVAAARTTRVHAGGRRAVGRPDTRPGLRPPRTPAWPSTPALPCLPDTSRPEGGCSGSSGRSIRRSIRLVTTSSTVLGRPKPDSVATARSELRCSYRTRYLIARHIKLSIGFMNSTNEISPRRCEVIVYRMLII